METSTRKSDFVSINGLRLHYLDWGGSGHALVLIPGMGCTAYIFDRFAPRFTDRFHVLALTRRGHGDSDVPETGYDPDTLAEDLHQFLDALDLERVILVGHSMGYVELTRFATLHPGRVLKLVYLDGAYNRTTPEHKAVFAKNPLPGMTPAWPEHAIHSIEEYAAVTRRLFPVFDGIWSPLLDEELRHTVKKNPDGAFVDRMPDSTGKALNDIMNTYQADYAAVQAPTLSFFVLRDGSDYLSSEYMTPEQQAQVLDFFQLELTPHQRKDIEQFRRAAPHAKIVEIQNGHHYCFIKQENVVYEAMRRFLLEDSQ